MRPNLTLSYAAMLFLLICLSSSPNVFAQNPNQVYTFDRSPIYIHPTANVNIYSDISHSGRMVSYENSLINFYGQVWQNEASSLLPDESPRGLDGIGGVFRFSDLNQIPQAIISISSQPFNGFPNLRIDNILNVTASIGNLHINNNLDFVRGHLILDNIDVNVGQQNSGSITGYGPLNFVVTGPDIEGGSLVRSIPANGGNIAFPIGSAIGSYTPASVAYTGNPQTFRLRVSENVYNKLNFPEYVYKTWTVKTDFPDATGSMELTLQHNTADEGNEYFRNRNSAYVSRYNTSLTGLWDVMTPMPGTTPGTITDRNPVFNAYINTRLNITALKPIEYFTKSVIEEDVNEFFPVNIPDAISPNGDGLNDTYIIEKRLADDVVRLEVYSRNQVLVYQSLDYQNDFNGTGNMGGFMGNTLPDGIYYYLISVNGAKGIPGYLVINR